MRNYTKKLLIILVLIITLSITFVNAKKKHIFSDYSPTISADGNTLIYQSDMYAPDNYKIYMKNKTEIGWTDPVLLDTVNSDADEGGPFITYDQNYLIFSSNRKGGIGDIDLWMSQRKGFMWTKPINMGAPINSPGYDGFASISPDGKTIYFVRECPEKKKCTDEKFGLYFSKKNNGKWTRPKKMPYPINSEYSEFGPIILADNITLIFSSTRPGGYGNYDLYKSERQYDGTWTKPTNLGKFINTKFEDKLVTIPASGELMYYAKVKKIKGNEVYRINSCPIPVELQQSKVLTYSGIVQDKKDPIKRLHAQITITNIKKDDRSIIIESNKDDGAYMVILNKGKIYDVSVKSKGYTFYSTKIDLTHLEYFKAMKQNILLEPLEIGAKIILNNMYFKIRSYNILKESKYELKRVIKLMKENPSMKLEIGGHTDDLGTYKYNRKLSYQRANSVMYYLIKRGLSKSRFISKGYGPNKPIVKNDSDENRKLNRRVEIKIIDI